MLENEEQIREAVFVARVKQEKPHEQIAKELSLPVETVRALFNSERSRRAVRHTKGGVSPSQADRLIREFMVRQGRDFGGNPFPYV